MCLEPTGPQLEQEFRHLLIAETDCSALTRKAIEVAAYGGALCWTHRNMVRQTCGTRKDVRERMARALLSPSVALGPAQCA
jgi:hypothetical protein